MTIASQKDDIQLALEYQQLANAIIAHCGSSAFAYSCADTINNFPVQQDQSFSDMDFADDSECRSLKIGPFEVRPAMNHEVPLGRSYQSIPVKSISRLAAYLGRDEHSLYIREVPDHPQAGLCPSKSGVWLRQPGNLAFRRLAPGEAARIGRQSDVRIGGNGLDGESAYRLFVI